VPARNGAAMVVARLLERGIAADHTLRRDTEHLLGDRAHEVTVAPGDDVVREPVRFEVAEQLDRADAWIRRISIPTKRNGSRASAARPM
jgi:hypothetical protein